MKFRLERASDWANLDIIEVNSLDELKQLNDKYNNKDCAFDDSHKIVIDFDAYKEDEEQGIDGIITIYDDYIE